MKIHSHTLFTALAIGTVLTLGLFGIGFSVFESDVDLSYTLYWQGLLLQRLVPCATVGGVALCESVPLNATLFWAGIPIGMIVYTALAYVVLRLIQRLRA